ncbi:MAG TPA: EthD family reductase [Candidatus Binataceae bacterium]|jgi:uncharacterized protein (TIGR02118 family)|nr:EthD family reductase [Candidatus Binataceae bacterium]
MVKGLFFAKRKPGISPRDFQLYWRSKHADLTRPLTHVMHYIQSHTLLQSYGNPNLPYAEGDPAYDGMATMWFNSTEERRLGNLTPAAQVAIDDQAHFTEMSARRFLLTSEVIQKDGGYAAPGVHLVALLVRKAGMSVEDFQRYWREHHGPLAAKVPQLRRYVQNHAVPELYGGRNAPLCDGVAEAWFDSLEDLQRSTETPEVKAVRADELNFMDVNQLVFILTEDIEIFRRY